MRDRNVVNSHHEHTRAERVLEGSSAESASVRSRPLFGPLASKLTFRKFVSVNWPVSRRLRYLRLSNLRWNDGLMKEPDSPRITFDTNIVALPEIRAFWATLCEEVGQRMVFTPTAAQEVLRRIRLETERDWEKRLKSLDKVKRLGLAGKGIRRLSTIAAAAARDHFQEEMSHQGSIYTRMSKLTPDLNIPLSHL